MSSHQALGQSDSGMVSRYTVTSKVPPHKGLECVYLGYNHPVELHSFTVYLLILFSASHLLAHPPPPNLSSVVDSSEASRLQQAEGQESGGAGTSDLPAAQGLKDRERETENEIRSLIWRGREGQERVGGLLGSRSSPTTPPPPTSPSA